MGFMLHFDFYDTNVLLQFKVLLFTDLSNAYLQNRFIVKFICWKSLSEVI